MKRFLLSLSPEVHEKLRQWAFKRNISMSRYVVEALMWRLSREVE